MQYDYKEVIYADYCPTCIHRNTEDIKDPCNECLSECINLHSHKPIRYKHDDKVKLKSAT